MSGDNTYNESVQLQHTDLKVHRIPTFFCSSVLVTNTSFEKGAWQTSVFIPKEYAMFWQHYEVFQWLKMVILVSTIVASPHKRRCFSPRSNASIRSGVRPEMPAADDHKPVQDPHVLCSLTCTYRFHLKVNYTHCRQNVNTASPRARLLNYY